MRFGRCQKQVIQCVSNVVAAYRGSQRLFEFFSGQVHLLFEVGLDGFRDGHRGWMPGRQSGDLFLDFNE